MDLRDLVRALREFDSLGAREWVQEAARSHFNWTATPEPEGLDPEGRAIAAGIVELLATRAGMAAPAWTRAVAAAPRGIFLVRAAEQMPRLRRACEEDGPEPLRRRQIFAPPEFLKFA